MEPLLEKLRDGGSANKVEQRMMLQYIAYLDEVASQNPSNENLEALREAVWLSDKFGGSEWGRARLS